MQQWLGGSEKFAANTAIAYSLGNINHKLSPHQPQSCLHHECQVFLHQGADWVSLVLITPRRLDQSHSCLHHECQVFLHQGDSISLTRAYTMSVRYFYTKETTLSSAYTWSVWLRYLYTKETEVWESLWWCYLSCRRRLSTANFLLPPSHCCTRNGATDHYPSSPATG